jgi:hypothetical protein
MQRVSPASTGEKGWFLHWTPEVEALLEPYARVVPGIALRTGEIQERVEYVLCARVIRHAMRHHPQSWGEASSLLQSKRPLAEVLRLLFGEQTPPSVGAMALNAVAQQAQEHDEQDDVKVGRQVRDRESEREQLGLPDYVWVVRLVGRNKMTVTVEDRAKLKDRTVGLVRVVDAR